MIHPDDQYYEPLSPVLLDTLCDIANGLTNSEIGEKHHITAVGDRLLRMYYKLGVQVGRDEGMHPSQGIFYTRLNAVLKATRIGLIIYDYETSQYVPNPDFKQPDRGTPYCPPRKRKIWTVDSFSDDKVERAKEALLSGEIPPSSIPRKILKTTGDSASFKAGNQKVALIKEELEAQGYKFPRYKPKYKTQKMGENHPWRKAEQAHMAEIVEREKKEEEHELVPIVRQSQLKKGNQFVRW